MEIRELEEIRDEEMEILIVDTFESGITSGGPVNSRCQ